MTHANHPEPAPDAGGNVFIDKIATRFIAAADALTAATAALDGRDHLTAKGLDDIRWAASSVARSMDAVGTIATHFESALTSPGGLDEDARQARADIQELHARGLVAAALAGTEVRA